MRVLLDGLMQRVAERNAALMAIPSRRPVGEARLGSAFGNRIDPFRKTLAFHSGVDFALKSGSDVAAGGRVRFAGYRGAYGKLVEIDHGNRLVTRYAHLSRLDVRKGDVVTPAQRIGAVGRRGVRPARICTSKCCTRALRRSTAFSGTGRSGARQRWLAEDRRPSTRELVRAEHRLQAARRCAGRLIILALLCVIGALLYLRLDEQAAQARQIEVLHQQNLTLSAELEHARLQRQEAQATEEQLLRRIATFRAGRALADRPPSSGNRRRLVNFWSE